MVAVYILCGHGLQIRAIVVDISARSGITYVDHKNKSVFNGSSLGKEFSAKGIQESCAMSILAFEKKYNNSISSNSENLQNFELSEYVKANLIDILLRGEKINDYISKQFKQRKKKRLYKGI